METKEKFIKEIIFLGSPPHSNNYEHELLPSRFVRHLISQGSGADNWGCGILALFIGCANWGVDWEGFTGKIPADPAGENWKGTAKRSGKHVMDGGSSYPWGGLAIPHLDSSALYRDCYERWGEPYSGAKEEKLDFNTLIESHHKVAYFKWADELLATPSFHEWVVEYWLGKFWAPSWEWARDIYKKENRYITADDVDSGTVNSRINNSLSGVASRLRDRQLFVDWRGTTPGKRGGDWKKLTREVTVDEQVDTYQGYKYSRRSSRNAERSVRQARQAQRVAVLWNLLCTPIF